MDQEVYNEYSFIITVCSPLLTDRLVTNILRHNKTCP